MRDTETSRFSGDADSLFRDKANRGQVLPNMADRNIVVVALRGRIRVRPGDTPLQKSSGVAFPPPPLFLGLRCCISETIVSSVIREMVLVHRTGVTSQLNMLFDCTKHTERRHIYGF